MKKHFEIIVEFVKNDKTEQGSISMTTAGKFFKDIGELASRYGFSANVVYDLEKKLKNSSLIDGVQVGPRVMKSSVTTPNPDDMPF